MEGDMTVAIDIHLPGVTADTYASLIGRVGSILTSTPGFLAHAAGPAPGGFRVIELWRSEADWGAFAEAHIALLAKAAGIVPEPRVQQLERVELAAARAGQHLGPERGGSPVVDQDDGASFRIGPIEILVKEDGRGTRHNLAVAEFRGTQFRIPPHTHTEHDETIHVVEGEMGVRLGDATFVARAGSSFTIPIGVVHSVWNETGKLVRFLNVIVPARYLDYFREMSMASGKGLPPPDVIARVMRAHGLQPVA